MRLRLKQTGLKHGSLKCVRSGILSSLHAFLLLYFKTNRTSNCNVKLWSDSVAFPRIAFAKIAYPTVIPQLILVSSSSLK